MAGSLVVRREQLDLLRKSVEEAFVARLCADLRLHRAALVVALGDEDLRQRVRVGIHRAKGHGMTKLYNIAMFVELMFLVAPNFDRYPTAAQVLASSSIPVEDRLDQVIFRMDEASWQQAKLLADPLAWQA